MHHWLSLIPGLPDLFNKSSPGSPSFLTCIEKIGAKPGDEAIIGQDHTKGDKYKSHFKYFDTTCKYHPDIRAGRDLHDIVCMINIIMYYPCSFFSPKLGHWGWQLLLKHKANLPSIIRVYGVIHE